ncbi:hypothetical protein [Limosilactobacillus fastidiosus]|uniref:Uncharacterized protein n=1 Tax=Limosilactobacillus fastidiosus TaxID=2759855 RepID=A0A7W3TYD2_9LACO|nr:hypothetical protein [Limosilactobacillus fastidiosus]MBB1062481.1 hypothetical protein [Limosilactobacillus fastidiosus]MBB1085568.1 hypothetical protein [Limosilactobacillus fastidiosus]MCD7083555.1 hypothetical protein [Limosilactobacillus fastidiosus]MCD7086021.1 hypothetical protein [Limosilactobacillus fastidiosus]MCD7114335.1 hypothetical protein [Limosilactobacillus fastidiosus]
MTGENARRIKNVLIGILVIIGVLAVLPSLLTLIMMVFSGLVTGFSFAYIVIVEMTKYWSVNIWTSFFYLGLLIAEIGLLVIIIPLIIWAIKWLTKAIKWIISVIKQRWGGK